MRIIISTIGTSLLTNQIRGNNEAWQIISQNANYTKKEYDKETLDFVEKLKNEIYGKLVNLDNINLRKSSAELNGILGFYKENLSDANEDIHFLITTDTYQGKIAGEIVQTFLNNSGINNVQIITIKYLSTKSKKDFSSGIKELLKWFDETMPGYKDDGYEIVFNLTGGFKSLQGYLNTIGMFYADKIIYIFESENELIEIPKLPIQIQTDLFEQNLSIFIQLAQDKLFERKTILQIPDTLLEEIDEGLVVLSDWGLLSWNAVKKDLLKSKLVSLPLLEYTDNFKKDFAKYNDTNYQIKLNETLAKVSVILQENNFNKQNLTSNGLQYSDCKNKTYKNNAIGHFRINDGQRISCSIIDNKLILLRHGFHDVCE